MFGIDDALGLGGAVLGGLFGGDGGGGQQTVSKDPWAEAAPWLKQNIATGQNLQDYYQQNPFNALQQAAYGQLLGQNNYVHNALPGLLSQLSQPVGFDRGNPGARPAPIQFPSMLGAASTGGAAGGMGGGMSGGLLGDMNVTQNPFRNGSIPAPAPAPVAKKEEPIFWGWDRNLYGDT